MKLKQLLSSLLCLFVLFQFSIAQTDLAQSELALANWKTAENDSDHPCITPDEYAYIERICNENAAKFIPKNASTEKIATPALIWPVVAASGFNDCSFFAITAHVDDDTIAGAESNSKQLNKNMWHVLSKYFMYIKEYI